MNTQIADQNKTTTSNLSDDDLKLLDQAVRKAQTDIQDMLGELKANNNEHASFMHEIAKTQEAVVKEV